MPFVGVTYSKQLDMLAGVLDEYCDEHGIERSSPERAEVGRRVTILSKTDGGHATSSRCV